MPSIFYISSLVVDPSNQSCLLIIDCIVLPGVASAEGQDFAESLSKLDKNVYQPVPAPEFIPVDFGDASRLSHLLNVTLTALCNCENSSFLTSFLFLSVYHTRQPLRERFHSSKKWLNWVVLRSRMFTLLGKYCIFQY
jgi:hypothetical protein